MPGGRLTHDERRSIAAWLAEGSGYAEIARRLGRPTSTVSREVARNGGPGGYTADRAQRATGARARRRGPAPVPEPAAGPVREFVEGFAALLAGTGLPRMAARVFACLLTADATGLTAAELVRRLRVSPASVSKTIGYLETMELVTREPVPGGRRERYLIGDDAWTRAWRTDTRVHDEVATAARRGAEIMGHGTPAAARLTQMSRFFGQVSAAMNGSRISERATADALTLVAALAHATRPLTVPELAAALGLPVDRVADAIEAVERRPLIADPFALRRTESRTVSRTETGAYALTPLPERLSAAQQAALDALA
ncbi:MarR family transcriptional regulator [Spongiactinospora sp. 9N601]|uniref:GbsR/MarR family transcriptional regulator n=1 Tax=Spongiactinospora sp. 9N601 TaxID=3375149 RepID=UPI0037AF058A